MNTPLVLPLPIDDRGRLTRHADSYQAARFNRSVTALASDVLLVDGLEEPSNALHVEHISGGRPWYNFLLAPS
jgi:hypothetical protein